MIDKAMLEDCKKVIENSEGILIGAGAGLSTAAGLEYGGRRFEDNFFDYIEKYQLSDMYSSAFYPFPTLEEKWGYFSRHIQLNRYATLASKLYFDLFEIVKSKDYFVITTNADSLFFRAGFAPEKIFATQGDYGKLQCEKACHETLYDNEEIVKTMVARQKNCRIPTELLPICPVCGEGLVPHLRIDQYFVENDDWRRAAKRYLDYYRSIEGKKLVLLELGVGFNTPSIIRWPFEKMAIANENSTLIRVNKENTQSTHTIPQKANLSKRILPTLSNN
jgi:NAD-dependent SIR2 family protein deacetylase